MLSNNVTTTTHSFPLLQSNVSQGSESTLINYSYNNNNVDPLQSRSTGNFNPSGNLTHIPFTGPQLAECQIQPHKRSSIEMEDEQIKADEPPTKQLLSEKKLFKQFGSLNIDGTIDQVNNSDDIDSDDSDEDNRSQNTSSNSSSTTGREEFNRYVYLLFKDKKNVGMPFKPANSTLDRLAREERDKLSKAVILWNPPPNNNFFGNVDEDDEDEDEDEEFRYSDHEDFLKKPLRRNSSLTITEVFDEDICNNISETTNCLDTDEVMLDD